MAVSALGKEPSIDLVELMKLERRFLTLMHEGSEVAERLTKEAQQDVSQNYQYPSSLSGLLRSYHRVAA